MTRRRTGGLLAAASVALFAGGAQAQGVDDAPARPIVVPRFVPTDPAAVDALIVSAERALASGDSARARSLFEEAASRRHSADIESGWVRAQMQSGDYRSALAFAAHVAGAHPQVDTGTTLYAWLLAVGGQHAEARKRVTAAREQWPGERPLAWVERQILGRETPPEPAPRSLRPYATGSAVPASARVIGTAVLVDARTALAANDAVGRIDAVWVRDGLGRTRSAVVLRRDEALGLAVLRLPDPLDGATVAPAARDPFPGSPAFFAGYAAGDGSSAWPMLRPGFLGPVQATTGERTLGERLLAARSAEPVFDHAGRMVGLGMQGRADAARFVPRSAWGDLLPHAGAVVAAVAGQRIVPERIYELALRSTLQVIVPGAAD